LNPGDIDIPLNELSDAIGRDSGVFPRSRYSSFSSSYMRKICENDVKIEW
jgi:hypothetical protein